MGKIQYKNAPNAPVEYSQPKKEKEAVPVLQNVKYDDIDKTELANSIKAVSDDYLKSSDKTELANRITNEAPVTNFNFPVSS